MLNNRSALSQGNIFLITANRIPSERANAYQTVKMADALSAQGWSVTLLAPRRRNSPAMASLNNFNAISNYYKLRRPFTIRYLSCLDLDWLKRRSERWWFLLISLSFALSLALYLVRHRRKERLVIYTREERFTGHFLARLKGVFGLPVLFESHQFPATQRNLAWQQRMDGIVTINRHLQQAYLQAGFPPERLFVAPDGVDLRLFAHLPAKEAARTQLQLPLERPLVVYTGHLFRWKGVYTMAQAGGNLPQACLLFVGGMAQDLEKFTAFVQAAALKNIQIIGHVPPERVPLYLASADILVLPNSAGKAISRLYTSPLKLFEYMAAGRPIVASDLPSLGEVLADGVNARLVPPDDPAALAAGIEELLSHPALAERLAHQARRDVGGYTWTRRAERVTRFTQQITGVEPGMRANV